MFFICESKDGKSCEIYNLALFRQVTWRKGNKELILTTAEGTPHYVSFENEAQAEAAFHKIRYSGQIVNN